MNHLKIVLRNCNSLGRRVGQSSTWCS